MVLGMEDLKPQDAGED